MPSMSLELHQVLEEEYVAMYGPLERPPTDYTAEQIANVPLAWRVLWECGFAVGTEADPDAAKIATALQKIVDAKDDPQALKKSHVITARGKALLNNYDEFAKQAKEQQGDAGARELRRSLVDEAFAGAVKPQRDARLNNVYRAIHARANDEKDPRPRSALCVSGGGIRSATFALGVIQGLASAEVLKKFDYLSTVSGGGYIGSWLSSWVRRHPDGVAGVESDLQSADTAVDRWEPYVEENAVHRSEDKPLKKDRKLPEKKIQPEPLPIRHLRQYSNYLSPRLGLLSGDAWTIGSLYVRNLLLNLLVLVPLLALLLAIPRVFSWAIAGDLLDPLVWPWFTAVLVTLGFLYIGLARPAVRDEKAKQRKLAPDARHLLLCVLPLTLASATLALFWARVQNPETEYVLRHPSTLAAAITAFLGMTLVPFLAYYGRQWGTSVAERRAEFVITTEKHYLGKKAWAELVSVIVALTTSGALLYLLAKKVFDDPLRVTPQLATVPPLQRFDLPSSPSAQLFVCFAVAAVLLVFFVQASVFVGLSSRKNEDADREWWGRAGAWLLFTVAAIALFSVVAVFGPVALYNAPVILGSIGGVAGVAAGLLGFSGDTAANAKQKDEQKTSAADTARSIGSALAVPLFVVFVLALISLASTWLIHQYHGGFEPSVWRRATNMVGESTRTEEVVVGGMKYLSKATLPATPLISLPALRSDAHLATIQNTTGSELLVFLVVAGVAGWLSTRIGVNKFSMHAFYRNRLIRAYLGASRDTRNPDAFTGFDEYDNLQMWQLRPELLWTTRLTNAAGLIRQLQKTGAGAKEQLAKHLRSALDEKTRELCALDETLDEKTRDRRMQELLSDPDRMNIAIDTLVQNLNHLLMTSDLTEVSGAPSPNWIATADNKIGYSKAFRNRAVLDHYFAEWIRPMALPADAKREVPDQPSDPQTPMHMVNMALNLTSGRDLAWQQRMAASFTASPLHTGSVFLGYRDSREYGGTNGISLGGAVTISGAAASPNMGYHSSTAMAFLLTLLNVRLGAWLGNPGPHGEKSYRNAHPDTSLRPLFAEMTGSANDQSKYVYLSDGGHFENLGLYEMILRRCHTIVVSDAGADPKFSFEDLGNAIRKIRTDLGIPIDVDSMSMAPRSDDGKFGEGRYVARATIRYSAIDAGAEEGTLIYIKAGVYDDPNFPRDVYNYAQESLAFPHEPTSDQFFSESQFESYRALGRHAVNDICNNYDRPTSTGPVTRIAKTFTTLDQFVRVAEGSTEKRMPSTKK